MSEILSELEIKEKIFDKVLAKYNEMLLNNFQSIYNVDPTPFRLSIKENVKGVIVEDGDSFPKSYTMLYFVYTPKEGNLIEKVEPSKDSIDEHYNYRSSEEFSRSIIVEHYKVSSEDILYSFSLDPFFIDNPDSLDNLLSVSLDRQIRESLRSYQSHVSNEGSYYAKNAAKYSYSLLDLTNVIKQVNDEDFEYQLNEAIAAYDNSLYMASAAALGVTIETLCIKILKNNEEKVKDSDPTMIDKLAERLKGRGLLTRKEQRRLKVAYDIRNIASHSSRGQVLQADCHYLLSVIHDLGSNKFLD